MGAVKDTATKVIKTVAKTTKNVVQGAVALARAVRGNDERDRDRQAGRPSRESKARGSSTRRRERERRDRREQEETAAPSPEPAEEPSEPEADLDEIWGVGEARADALREMGLTSVREVADASADQLQQMQGVGGSTAEKIKESARELSA